jgi:hypothetical protein
MGGVHGALAARHSAHTTQLALLAEVEAKRARLAKLKESGKGDAARILGDEREVATATAVAATARREYEELCERMAAELLRADAARAAQLAALAKQLGAAQRDLARDQAAAFALMRVRG